MICTPRSNSCPTGRSRSRAMASIPSRLTAAHQRSATRAIYQPSRISVQSRSSAQSFARSPMRLRASCVRAACYTFTGRTGEGKTAFLVILALAVALELGERLIGRKVKKGRVAFCTAETPDDLRMRLMVACFVFNLDLDVIDRDIMI